MCVRAVSAWVLDDQNLDALPHDAWKIEWICTAVERTLHHVKATIQAEKDKSKMHQNGADGEGNAGEQEVGLQEGEGSVVSKAVDAAKSLALSLFSRLGAKLTQHALQNEPADQSGWQGHNASSMDPPYVCWLSLCKWTVRTYRSMEREVHKVKGEFVSILDEGQVLSELSAAGVIEPVRVMLQ